MRSIDFIYFDLGNVLLRFSHLRASQQIGELVGVEPRQVWQVLFEGDLNRQFDLGKINARQFHQLFANAIGRSTDFESFFRAYNDIFSINNPVVPLVLELEKTKIPLGILSNTCQSHWDFVLQRYKWLGANFRSFILSFEVGSCKPETKIFEKAIEKAAAPPERIFFVDDLTENVQGAISCGIDAIVFESAKQLRNNLRQRGFDV